MSKIYEPQGRAREYSPLALNFFKGCTHNCEYCYVPRMMGRFNANYDHSQCSVNLNVAELEKSARKFQGCNKQILLSFTGDPYCGIDNDATKIVLETLLKYNHKVAILTKGGSRCLEHLDLFKKFGENIKVGATLTFDNDFDSLKWESGAALPNDRISALKTLSKNGVKTWVSFEPVVFPKQSLNLLSQVSSFVDHVKIGKLNNYNGLDKNVDWSAFIFHAVKICRDANLKFYIKKDLQIFNKGVYLSGDEINEDFLNL